MKSYGDIPEAHLERVKELEALENWFNKKVPTIPALSAAKGLICIAHDYYYIDFEEEGERFLKMANDKSPGYFKGPIYDQMIKDGDFAQLVEQLCEMMALDVMESLGFKDE